MGSVNKVILVGNLGRDAELRYTPGGAAVATVNMATTEVWNDKSGQRQEKTEWHRVVLWGKTAESLTEYLTKGKQIYVEGRLQTRQWDDKDGNKRYTTEIRGDRVVLLGGGGGGGGRGSGGGGSLLAGRRCRTRRRLRRAVSGRVSPADRRRYSVLAPLRSLRSSPGADAPRDRPEIVAPHFLQQAPGQRNRRRRHAELRQAEADEQRQHAGSEAISPQSDTGMPRRRAARRTITTIRRIAGWSGAYSRDTRASERSTARRYLNQIVRTDGEEVDFTREQIGRVRGRRHLDHHADRHSLASGVAHASSAAASATIRRASRICFDADTKGNMMRSAPCLEARSSARNWTRNSSGLDRLRRRPRSPCARLPASQLPNVRMRHEPRRQLLFVDVEVRTVTMPAPCPRACRVDFVCACLRRGRTPPVSRNSERYKPDAFGARIARGREVVGKFDVRVEINPHTVGGHCRPAGSPSSPAGRRSVGVVRRARASIFFARVKDQFARCRRR